MKKVIALFACGALLAGCANVGTVNGVPVNRGNTTSTQGKQPYCEANPAVCIIGGAVGIGILKYLINKNDGGNKSDESWIVT